MSAAEVAALVADGYDSGEDGGNEFGTGMSTNNEGSDDESCNYSSSNNDLDGSVGSKTHALDSNALLAKLGPSPTTEQIASLAATKAQEYIVECFDDDSSTLDKEKFDAIPCYVKSDLMIGQFLGKGSFSDAFEVTLVVKKKDEGLRREVNLDANQHGEEDDVVDTLITAATVQFGEDSNHPKETTIKSLSVSYHGRNRSIDYTRRRPRRSTSAHSRSVCMGTLQNTSNAGVTRKTLAMKCLRPQIRANAQQFLLGVEDLIHETAILASLDHPNIIKIHGRSGSSVSDSFRLSDGYFILLDRLADTLEDRLKRWAKAPRASNKGPSVHQLRVLSSLADAVLFLHDNYICFRDLKPANVGFSETGVLKLFDFGFAISVDENKPNSLFEKCGTLRYMATEVGLGFGYGLEADVFSFGMILWEVCALKKPFCKIKSAAEFEDTVFVKNLRPKMKRKWNEALKNLISECWSQDPQERPVMSVVKSIIAALTEEFSRRDARGSSNSLGKSLRRSIARRVTWD